MFNISSIIISVVLSTLLLKPIEDTGTYQILDLTCFTLGQTDHSTHTASSPWPPSHAKCFNHFYLDYVHPQSQDTCLYSLFRQFFSTPFSKSFLLTQVVPFPSHGNFAFSFLLHLSPPHDPSLSKPTNHNPAHLTFVLPGCRKFYLDNQEGLFVLIISIKHQAVPLHPRLQKYGRRPIQQRLLGPEVSSVFWKSRAFPFLSSQKHWLPASDLHKFKPVSTPAQMTEGLRSPHPQLRSHVGSWQLMAVGRGRIHFLQEYGLRWVTTLQRIALHPRTIGQH